MMSTSPLIDEERSFGINTPVSSNEESPFFQVAGMWNDFFSSLMHLPPAHERQNLSRMTQAQLNRLAHLQLQHQQLMLQQLHLLLQQHKLRAKDRLLLTSTNEEQSTFPVTPVANLSPALTQALKTAQQHQSMSPSLPVLPVEVWQQFQSLQAQQWSQALALAKSHRDSNMGPMQMRHMSNAPNGGGKRCKAYAAPKGVWKNNGGYNATIYVHKRRIYGPIRRDLQDAIDDRKEMEDALKDLLNGQAADVPAALEAEMRDVVSKLRNKIRSRPEGVEADEITDDMHGMKHEDDEYRVAKRSRLNSGFSGMGSPEASPMLHWRAPHEFHHDDLVLDAPRFCASEDDQDDSKVGGLGFWGETHNAWGSSDFVSAARHH